MSVLKDINVRPILDADKELLEILRRRHSQSYLELPKGFTSPSVATQIAEKDGRLIGSLTGTLALVCDPFIHDDENANGPEIFAAVYLMERVLTSLAQADGAVDSYIAVPNNMPSYQSIVERAGYTETCINCRIYRRPLRPDTHPLLEMEDAKILLEQTEATPPPALLAKE